MTIDVEGRPDAAFGSGPAVRFDFVSPGHLDALGTRLVAGRGLAWADSDEARRVVLVAENLASSLWGDPRTAIGKRIRWQSPWEPPDVSNAWQSDQNDNSPWGGARLGSAGSTGSASRPRCAMPRSSTHRTSSRIKKLFDDAIEKGARVAVGGVLTPDMLIMQEEIFASIVPVMTYDDVDEAVEYISGRDKPLAMYIYSNDQNHIDKVLSRTSSGGVTINGFFSHYLENQLPFGGVNQSGTGRYHGHFGFKAFSHERAVYTQQPR